MHMLVMKLREVNCKLDEYLEQERIEENYAVELADTEEIDEDEEENQY